MPEKRKPSGARKGAAKKKADVTERFEKAVARLGEGEYVLRLYVAGTTPRSARAIANLKNICEEHLAGRYDLNVVDVYQQPTLAKGEQIIAIDSEFKDDFVVVRIADSGPGVPRKIRELIFEPFYTTRGQGTGIGLAFCRRVLDSVGARIEVGSSALGGAEFGIRISAGERQQTPRRGASGG